MTTIREPAVAGSFYPSSPPQLGRDVDTLLAAATPARSEGLRALAVPHAGYVYSGPIAATAYATLRQVKGIRTVLLLGPSHYFPLGGVAWTEADHFRTPLGTIRVDRELLARIATAPKVRRLEAAHRREHSLEVQLPFLQRILPDTPVLPIVVGEATAEDVADVILAAWSPGVFPIVSTDLSHYLPYGQAVETDRETMKAVVSLTPVEPGQACGAMPLNGLLVAARRRGLSAEVLDLRNSGDTSGERAAVVGYAAVGFYEAGGAA